ncbi:MAG: LacI family DNA-binding transcriptional regulator [Anaerolineae bacterium]
MVTVQDVADLAGVSTATVSRVLNNHPHVTGETRSPQDVAIVGFDDMPWAPSLDPPLTVVAKPTYELGCTAASLLLQRIVDERVVVSRFEGHVEW